MNTTLSELIKKVKTGEDAAEEELTRRFDGMIRSVAVKYVNIPGYDTDDLVQDGRMKLLAVAGNFDESKTDTFSAYFRRALINKYNELARKAGADINVVINLGAAFDSTENSDDGEDEKLSPSETVPSSSPTPEDVLLGNERDEAFYSDLRSILSELEYAVIVPYFNRVPYKEIAKRLGVSEKKVDNSIYSAKKKYLAHKGDSLKRYRK